MYKISYCERALIIYFAISFAFSSKNVMRHRHNMANFRLFLSHKSTPV